MAVDRERRCVGPQTRASSGALMASQVAPESPAASAVVWPCSLGVTQKPRVSGWFSNWEVSSRSEILGGNRWLSVVLCHWSFVLWVERRLCIWGRQGLAGQRIQRSHEFFEREVRQDLRTGANVLKSGGLLPCRSLILGWGATGCASASFASPSCQTLAEPVAPNFPTFGEWIHVGAANPKVITQIQSRVKGKGAKNGKEGASFVGPGVNNLFQRGREGKVVREQRGQRAHQNLARGLVCKMGTAASRICESKAWTGESAHLTTEFKGAKKAKKSFGGGPYRPEARASEICLIFEGGSDPWRVGLVSRHCVTLVIRR